MLPRVTVGKVLLAGLAVAAHGGKRSRRPRSTASTLRGDVGRRLRARGSCDCAAASTARARRAARSRCKVSSRAAGSLHAPREDTRETADSDTPAASDPRPGRSSDERSTRRTRRSRARRAAAVADRNAPAGGSGWRERRRANRDGGPRTKHGERAAIAGEERRCAESRAGAVVVEAGSLRDALAAFLAPGSGRAGRSVTPSGRESIAPSTVRPPHPRIQTLVPRRQRRRRADSCLERLRAGGVGVVALIVVALHDGELRLPAA